MCPRGSVSGAIFTTFTSAFNNTAPGFTFLTMFLMSKSFSWPFPHISCLAVYSWWVWVLLWQRFLWSSAWSPAQVDYCNRPCYRLLLFSAVVAATEDPLKSSSTCRNIDHFTCQCGPSVSVTAHGAVACCVYQFTRVMVPPASPDTAERGCLAICFRKKGGNLTHHILKKMTDGLRLINFLFAMLQSMCAPSWVNRIFINLRLWHLADSVIQSKLQICSALLIETNKTKSDAVKTDVLRIWLQSNCPSD